LNQLGGKCWPTALNIASLLVALSATGCPGYLDGRVTGSDGSFMTFPVDGAGGSPDGPNGGLRDSGAAVAPADLPPAPPVTVDAAWLADAAAPVDSKPAPPLPDAASVGNGADTAPAAAACSTAQEISSKILVPRCATCHSRDAPAGSLDLESPGAKARLLNIPSRGCSGKILVTAGAQVTGHLFDKLAGPVTGCGNEMPFQGQPLNQAQIQCLKDWFKPTP
jgi:hypothetical protein